MGDEANVHEKKYQRDKVYDALRVNKQASLLLHYPNVDVQNWAFSFSDNNSMENMVGID